ITGLGVGRGRALLSGPSATARPDDHYSKYDYPNNRWRSPQPTRSQPAVISSEHHSHDDLLIDSLYAISSANPGDWSAAASES
ncbi:MAG: hypothetical protein O6933_08585, partial [Planctomycetota bacterium]|nr:hypothetical protein [Planctomycetota bacterium]